MTRRPSPPAWAVPYRPLRLRRLVLQLAVLVPIELLLYRSYDVHDARFHYATHLLVAVIASCLWLGAFLVIAARPARGQLWLLLVLHVWAMLPDLLFRAGTPHYRWMDVFLGHVASHYLPGGDTAWLVLALLALGGYGALLSLWVRARTVEAASGLPPAIGVGGAAVVRPQQDPRQVPLAHTLVGAAPARVVLLHGLGGTRSLWTSVAERLRDRGCSSLAVDLLGHGDSLDTGTRFTLVDQADAVIRLLRSTDDQPVLLVAHSYGCAVAVAVAKQAPDLVRRLALISPPAFADADVVRERFGRRSWLARTTVRGAPAAGVVCGLMCLLRGPLERLAPRAAAEVPGEVATGAVRHSYPAYRDALTTLLVQNPLPDALVHPPVATAVLLGDADETVPRAGVASMPRAPGVRLDVTAGDHLLPLRRAEVVAGWIVDVEDLTGAAST